MLSYTLALPRGVTHAAPSPQPPPLPPSPLRSVDEAMGRIVRRHMQANGDSRERAEARVAVNDRLNAEAVWGTRGRAQVLVPSFPF